jgi:hypothetical protein
MSKEALYIVASLCADKVLTQDEENILRKALAKQEQSTECVGEPVGEPVGEILLTNGDYKEVSWKNGKLPPVGAKLYTTPQQRTWVGLTDEEREQVYRIWRFHPSNETNLHLCKAVEAKLKEKNT